uniref:Autophagy-related protein 13 n=1 Tax=Bionectria ochroleuca TaxID=29856 RepID=A0A8H7NFR5_BIOOC
MHQQPRVPPRVSSPTASPQLNQYRNNASRDSAMSASRSRAGSTVSGRDIVASPTLETPQSPLQMLPAESVKKLDQIIQNFFIKVATLVIDSRIKVKPSRGANNQRKTSKWFQIETDEFEDFKEELKTWKPTGNLESLPPPLTVEIYLDTSSLKDSQSLTIVDEDGKRWDVMEQLNAADVSTGSRSSGTPGKITEVILERWRVELEPNGSYPTDDFGPILPTVYKKAIVFFRSLFTATRLFPAWKFASQGLARNSLPALIPRCRIRASEGPAAGPDLLRYPIMGRSEPVTDYVFGDLETPVGRLKTSVTYRNDCSFRVDDSEALLSSRFMGIDEDFFKPSLTQRNRGSGQQQTTQIGSLQSDRPGPLSNIGQTYGSLSTFHGDGPLGTSPISALKAVKSPGSASSSPPASFSPQPGIEPPILCLLQAMFRQPARAEKETMNMEDGHLFHSNPSRPDPCLDRQSQGRATLRPSLHPTLPLA